MSFQEIINVAIIAHVDHGKTTLLDMILKQTGAVASHETHDERMMDSNKLEKERGITILAKCTSVIWKDVKINIIDTPGHADFGAEVERVMSMADCVLLLVDSAEGPMPQTKFVLTKALKAQLKPIVIVNKIDRHDARHEEVLNEIYDLFLNLDASDEQLDFPVLYAAGRDGWCVKDLALPRENLHALFDTILEVAPKKPWDYNAPFKMLVSLLEADKFLGRILIGRILQGTASVNMPVKVLDLDNNLVENAKLTKLLSFYGLSRKPTEIAVAGDIIAIAGLEKCSVADTVCDLSVNEGVKSYPIDPPTMSITISVNDSPFAGQEGTKVTSRVIRDRLFAEAQTNVAIKVIDVEGGALEVSGRGELQLGVLIENMRREGYELSVSRPRVVFKYENGEKLEPVEEVVIDVDDEYSGVVMEKLNFRKGQVQSVINFSNKRTRINYLIPSRALIGYHSEFLTDTRGTGIMNRLFNCYQPYHGKLASRTNGALISSVQGEAVAYAIFNLQDRGIMFIKPQDKVYVGMIIGEHNRNNDLEVNVMKGKQLSNVRSTVAEEAVKLPIPKIMTLEENMSYLGDHELLEVTPKSLRLRKKFLDPNMRKRHEKSSEN